MTAKNRAKGRDAKGPRKMRLRDLAPDTSAGELKGGAPTLRPKMPQATAGVVCMPEDAE